MFDFQSQEDITTNQCNIQLIIFKFVETLNMEKCNIIIIDDQPIYLMGMELLLGKYGFSIDSYNSSEIALEHIVKNQSNIIITELNMPEMDAYSLHLSMMERGISIPIIAMLSDFNYTEIRNSIDFGVKGFIPRNYSPESILIAIENTINNGCHFPECICQVLKQRHINNDINHEEVSLSNKQKRVLSLLVKGYSNKKIALILNISTDTVKFHLGGIYRIMNVTNRTAAAAKAKNEDLIESQVA
ncbi:response regulator transcription factor [Photobacterium sanguinicancri]|uniref:response regulator transcription factor n=1 Tax=Photobacterium sanguinicancri TaxID=875932 RepID=UPI0026E1428D|nr:response regulator transcription factor [Photobacterium sanguinicancri]MDO6498214.1 response regulator transcription factor [Photobacterium sanguinicancri]